MEKIDLKYGKAVRVFWVDSAMSSGWHYGTIKLTPEKIVTLGFVVVTTSEGLTLTTSISGTGGVVGPLTLPWGSIQKLEQLPDEWERNGGLKKSIGVRPVTVDV